MKIEYGVITDDEGRMIGTVTHTFRYGQPAIRVQVGSQIKWFEKDEKYLLARIADFARERIFMKSPLNPSRM